MEKKKLQPVNEEDLKAATGGFSFRGCKSKSTKKNCESYSDLGCRWNEGKQRCGFN